ncbi:uncharacterized protein Z518_00661 [Rhinocladiella mackenziei CBS 650.93]|uniref:FAD/NAD(P)-binding domain-containing protein n=1 Tax=Rhinocladiella mackenziei CBS 650.93 TaxID=1442369 RepID=A0A0D2J1M9_9EURO|nr:uncharacterized protein Z518_00661 [Rhinocladiella mackenziei CBS 650.93]KIX09581.1 hypothetical protein Z518_00661 [Rhinocladiella mackenziei CBS 650.93]
MALIRLVPLPTVAIALLSCTLAIVSHQSRLREAHSPAMAGPAYVYDALVIGGGPAGLSTALGLARQLYTTIVFDSGQYRNDPTEKMHNVLTWDHRHPTEYRATAHANILARYSTVQFQNTSVESITKGADGTFEAIDKNKNKYTGKRVVLATGVKDILLDIPGYKELWGRSIFHCLFCHGYEERRSSSAGVLAQGVLADPQLNLHMARMVARLAASVTIYSNGDITVTEQLEKQLAGKPLTIEPRRITSLERKGTRGSDMTVHFEDGNSKDEVFLAHIPRTEINGPFLRQLDVEVENGVIKTVPPFYETTVSGVFAVGDCATALKTVTQAVAMGSFGAGGVAQQLGGLGNL